MSIDDAMVHIFTKAFFIEHVISSKINQPRKIQYKINQQHIDGN